jgi:DNA-binding NarL/FixJ family response regulator
MGGDETRLRDRATVLMASGDPARGQALSGLLRTAGFDVRVGDLAGATGSSPGEAPDVWLLEIDPDAPGDAIATAEQVSEAPGSSKVVVVAPDENPETFLDAMRAGAAGYIVRDGEDEHIGESLWDVLAGRPAVPRRFLRLLIDELEELAPERGVETTHRPIA